MKIEFGWNETNSAITRVAFIAKKRSESPRNKWIYAEELQLLNTIITHCESGNNDHITIRACKKYSDACELVVGKTNPEIRIFDLKNKQAGALVALIKFFEEKLYIESTVGLHASSWSIILRIKKASVRQKKFSSLFAQLPLVRCFL